MLQYGADALGSGFEDLDSDTELIRVRERPQRQKVCYFHLHRVKKKDSLSTRVSLVYQGLQDLPAPLDSTCHHLTQLKASFQGTLDHPAPLAQTGSQANLDYQ